LPAAEWKPAAITREAIEKRYVDEYLTVLKIGIQTRTRRYQQAIAANGADVEAHLQIGIILATAGDHSESMKYFDQVLKLEPKNAAALNNRANLHFLSDRLQEAEADYLAATRQDGSDPYLWVNLARTYKAQKRVEEAKTAFTRAVELDASMKREFRVLALELLNRL
jgi:tetratricopeptide (TPR) repeat protein